MERVAALVALLVLAVACLGRPNQQGDPTPDPGDELSDFTTEDRPPWKGSATVKLTGALNLDLVFTFTETNSPRRGPGLVDLNFESNPYSLLLTGETGNPASEAFPMALILSVLNGEDLDAISGETPQCVFTFPQPGPAAIVGDAKCTALANTFSDAGTVDLMATFSISPEG